MVLAVTTGHEATADVAFEVMRSGGNAFDAAIAAFAASFVAEPCMCSPGGGAIATIRTAEGKSFILDFFCQTPKKKPPIDQVDLKPIEVDFGTKTDVYYAGLGSVAVPGSVAGIFKMHEMFGYMPIRELFEPCIQFANKGIMVNEFQALDFFLLENILTMESRGKELFTPEGALKTTGENFKMPHLADFMEYLGREGSDAFYKGEVATRIISACEEYGGCLTADDLASYETNISQGIEFLHEGKKVITPGFPSMGGMILHYFMHHLSDMGHVDYLGEDHFKHLVNSCLRASSWLKGQYEEKAPFDSYQDVFNIYGNLGGTSHLCVMDRMGNAVSLSTTIGEGSGHFVKGTDIHLNNMLGETGLLPGELHSWPLDKRSISMMTPTIVLNEEDQLDIILGSGGAMRIPYMIGQVIHNLVHFRKSVYDAVSGPRVYFDGINIQVEPGHSKSFDEFQGLPVHHWDDSSLYFGGVHCITKEGNAFYGCGDERRDGAVRISVT